VSGGRIVITGATSGLGRELAAQYAAELGERAHLGLVGRRAERLAEVAAACRAAGATVRTYAHDVADGPAMAALAEDFLAAAGGVDLVIANAGIGTPDRLSSGDPAPLATLLQVNVIGVVNTVVPFAPALKRQGSGQVVVIASIAGYRPYPGHATYSASKKAVQVLMDGFAYDLNRWGVAVTTINPGFVVSELTADNRFPMPFLLQTDEAVRRMRRAIRRRRRVYTFPLPTRLLGWSTTLLPRFAVQALLGRHRGRRRPPADGSPAQGAPRGG